MSPGQIGKIRVFKKLLFYSMAELTIDHLSIYEGLPGVSGNKRTDGHLLLGNKGTKGNKTGNTGKKHFREQGTSEIEEIL